MSSAHPSFRRPTPLVVLFLLAVVALALSVATLKAEPVDRPETSAAAQADAGPWPQWRGPQRDASVAADAAWPESLAGLETVWSVDELGPSYSGPIVADDRIFVTETRDETFEVVSAYDLTSGERLWTKQWPGSMEVPFFAKKNGDWIRSTPAWDGETLFVGGMLEVLVALDGDTGAERWRIDFPKRFGKERPPFGFVCSPLVAGDRLFVEAADSVFALDKDTGEILWRSGPWREDDMMSAGSFSSPVLADVAGRTQLLVQTRLDLRGLDPDTGEVLWVQEVPAFRGMNILTPTPWRDGIFTSSYRNGSYLYRLDEGADGWRSSLAWESKVQGYMSSPVRVGDVVYQHLGNGRLSALDLASGEILWTTQSFGDYWSSARNGDLVLSLDDGGTLRLWRADPAEFRLLDERSVADEPTWAHLAVADDLVVVRSQGALTVWRWGGESAPAEAADQDAPSTAASTSSGVGRTR